MPVNWDELGKELDGIVDKAGKSTDKKLASRISSLTRMTDREVLEMFPEPADVKKLCKLMEIVNSAEARNTKVNDIVSNAGEFAGIILTLLAKFV